MLQNHYKSTWERCLSFHLPNMRPSGFKWKCQNFFFGSFLMGCVLRYYHFSYKYWDQLLKVIHLIFALATFCVPWTCHSLISTLVASIWISSPLNSLLQNYVSFKDTLECYLSSESFLQPSYCHEEYKYSLAISTFNLASDSFLLMCYKDYVQLMVWLKFCTKISVLTTLNKLSSK